MSTKVKKWRKKTSCSFCLRPLLEREDEKETEVKRRQLIEACCDYGSFDLVIPSTCSFEVVPFCNGCEKLLRQLSKALEIDRDNNTIRNGDSNSAEEVYKLIERQVVIGQLVYLEKQSGKLARHELESRKWTGLKDKIFQAYRAQALAQYEGINFKITLLEKQKRLAPAPAVMNAATSGNPSVSDSQPPPAAATLQKIGEVMKRRPKPPTPEPVTQVLSGQSSSQNHIQLISEVGKSIETNKTLVPPGDSERPPLLAEAVPIPSSISNPGEKMVGKRQRSSHRFLGAASRKGSCSISSSTSSSSSSSAVPVPVANLVLGKSEVLDPRAVAALMSKSTTTLSSPSVAVGFGVNVNKKRKTSDAVAARKNQKLYEKMRKFVPTMPGTAYKLPLNPRTIPKAVTFFRHGVQVWVCPICKKDEKEQVSRNMICCDVCEIWFHWSCVGIRYKFPKDHPWFCKRCVFKVCKDPAKEFPTLFG